jgi:hypothetical protein
MLPRSCRRPIRPASTLAHDGTLRAYLFRSNDKAIAYVIGDVALFDFGHGDAEYTRWLGNQEVQEVVRPALPTSK